MKKITYEIENPKGTLDMIVLSTTPEDKIKYECDCAYSAWKDTDQEEDNYLDLPEYIVGCLMDAGITVAPQFEFKEIN